MCFWVDNRNHIQILNLLYLYYWLPLAKSNIYSPVFIDGYLTLKEGVFVCSVHISLPYSFIFKGTMTLLTHFKTVFPQQEDESSLLEPCTPKIKPLLLSVLNICTLYSQQSRDRKWRQIRTRRWTQGYLGPVFQWEPKPSCYHPGLFCSLWTNKG